MSEDERERMGENDRERRRGGERILCCQCVTIELKLGRIMWEEREVLTMGMRRQSS